MRVELPGGNWAEMADPKTLTEGKRRPMKIAMAKVNRSATMAGYFPSGDPKADQERMIVFADPELLFAAADEMIAALVTTWSYPTQPSAAAAQSLAGDQYDALVGALMTVGSAEIDIVNPPADNDPSHPFAPTNGSGLPSPGNPVATSAPNGVTTGLSV